MRQKLKLATYVRVAGRRWGPDDDVPADVAAKITNPKVWAQPGDDGGAGPTADAGQKRSGGTRAGARLATHVHVGGRRYGPDDEIPDEVARRITNPKAWEGGVLPTVDGGGAAATAPADTTPPAADGQDAAQPSAPAAPDREWDRMPAPPRSGRGSGIDAWQAFAVDHDVEFPDGASRDDIIAACVAAHVIPAE